MKKVIIDADSLCFIGPNDPLERAINKLELKIELIQELCKSSNIKFYLTMGKTFRNEIYSEYKENRKDKVISDNVKKLKNYLIEKYNAIYEQGYEADDLVMDEYRKDMKNSILCSIDKDLLKNIEGIHLNLYSYEFVKVTKEEAIENFHLQTIIGDPTDNIPSISKGMGPSRLKQLKHQTGLSYEEICKYICYKKEIDYKTRYRLIYCGKSEDIEITENKITENQIIDMTLLCYNSQVNKMFKTKIKNENKKTRIKNIKVGNWKPESPAPGKYKGHTWLYVLQNDPNYVNWFISVTDKEDLKQMLQEMVKNQF